MFSIFALLFAGRITEIRAQIHYLGLGVLRTRHYVHVNEFLKK